MNFSTVPPLTALACTFGPSLPAFCTVILKSGALLFRLCPRPSPRLSGALMIIPPPGYPPLRPPGLLPGSVVCAELFLVVVVVVPLLVVV